MPYFLLILLLQILCAVHVVRTGRSYIWIFLIVFVPLLGIVIYLIAEVAPELFGSPRARRAAAGVSSALDPGRALREAERRLAISETAENKAKLAAAYLEVGRLDEALRLFREALVGIHATDPGMMLGLAQTHFARGEFVDAQKVIEELREANPGYTSPEAQLLHARSLEAQSRADEALKEYARLAPIYPGEEARYRYAILLRQNRREDEARHLLEEICRAEQFATRYTKRLQGQWYSLARRALAE